MWVRLLQIAVVLAMTGQAAIAGAPIGSIHLGQWSGGAFVAEKTGAFTLCAATAAFESGFLLTIAQDSERTWLLAIAHPSWSLTPGDKFSLELTFDGQAQYNFPIIATNALRVIGPLPEVTAERLRRSRSVAAAGKVQTVPLVLHDVDKLMPVIALCVDRVKAGGIAAADVDFVALAKKGAAPAAASAAPEKAAAAPAERPSTPKVVEKSGTGFVVSPNGHVVTNFHVIDKCVSDLRGSLTGEGATSLRVVSADELNDLALLQAHGTFKQPATIRSGPVHSGDGVIAIGFPYHGLLTSDFTVTAGIVNSLSGILNDTRFLQISAQVQPGNSGGPLLDTSGLVVGVVAEKLNALKFASATGNIPENISFAIKQGALRDFLDNSVVPYKTADAQKEMKTAEVASAARAYTMLVSCRAKEAESAKR
jgi:S1-C subfamily serine protease